MNKYLLFTLFILPGCGVTLTQNDPSMHCYFSPGDEEGFYLILNEEDTPMSSLRIEGPSGEDPVTVYGSIENGAFTHPDGHKLFFDATRAWGEKGSFIEDIEASATTCPR